MAVIAAGMASSHAYAFDDMDDWEARRLKTRKNYARRYGEMPPERPEVESESIEGNRQRFGQIVEGLDSLAGALKDLDVTTVVLVGDDQDENFRSEFLPQFAMYTGGDFEYSDKHEGKSGLQSADQDLSAHLLEEFVAADFDVSYSEQMPGGKLVSHAHVPLLHRLGTADQGVPVVPFFVNAIHVPAPSPARCYDLGVQLGEAIRSAPGDSRVAIYASGGLSHFTAGYPWPHYEGDATVGSICEDFDRYLVEAMRDGRGEELKALDSAALLQNGDVEFRQWMVLLGALGGIRPQFLHYQPFYRAVLGMGVGLWVTGD